MSALASFVLTASIESDEPEMTPEAIAEAIELMDFRIRIDSPSGVGLSDDDPVEVHGDLMRPNSGPHYVARVNETVDWGDE